MVNLKLGDRVSCKLNGSTIVDPTFEYTEIKSFEVVGTDNSNYYLYVPQYYCVADTIKVDNYNCKKIGILPKFVGEDVICVNENKIHKVICSLDGMFCDYCKEFYDFAISNQGDGTLICWNCRQNPLAIK